MEKMTVTKGRRCFMVLLASCWTLGIGVSIALLGRYEFTSGENPEELTHWPARLPIVFDPQKLNLIVAAHPHCPCSRISLSELKLALNKAVPTAIHLVYYRPSSSSAEWSQSDLVTASADLTGARVHFDGDGK